MTTNTHRRYADTEQYVKSYGDDILLQCSLEDATNLVILDDNGQPLQTSCINATTVQVKASNLNLGPYKYTCENGQTGCNHSVTVRVVPAMSIASPSFGKLDIDVNDLYFAPLEEDHEVFCTGPDTLSLFIDMDEWDEYNERKTDRQVQTVINSSTVMYRARVDRTKFRIYTCSGEATTKDETYTVDDQLKVIVSYYPKSHNFRCLISDWSVLECYWQYSYSGFKYSLFYKDLEDESETPMCLDMPGEIIKHNTCKWNIKHKGQNRFVINRNLSIVLETCNILTRYCKNETFIYKTNSLIKLNLNGDLHFVGGHDDVVYWFHPDVSVTSVSFKCEICKYRVEYRLTATSTAWRPADMSTARCNHIDCFFELKYLPYPDNEYELRVSARLIEAGDLWSEPSNILTVHTDKKAACACEAPLTADTTGSPATARCDACTLRESIIKENLALIHKINAIKKKLATTIEISHY
ncbi:uncharacterized protein LOC134675829 [Cydia fagiglandana]|uniref:uncharacterized protein LOC134675829 n=1 Tax=Cydia fagiglandana TaxID=1458189 RepID=UPI002FEE31B1